MTISRDVLEIEAAMQTILDTILGHHDRVLTASWSTAWASVVDDLEAGLTELALLGEDTPGWKITQHQRVVRGLEAAGEALDVLARDAGALFIDDATNALGLGVDGEIAMIGQQLPPGGPSPVRVDVPQLEAILARTTEQITAVSWPISAETSLAIRSELARGMIVGDNPREAARRMLAATEGRFTGGLSRALNVSRTEMLDAMRSGQYATDQANTAVLGGWTWGAHLDSRTCIACVSMHGTEFPADAPGPEDHQSGRCARIPRTLSWAELGFPNIPEPDLGMVDAEAWFGELPTEEQIGMLGPARFNAWQAGNYPISDWSRTRTTDGWRNSIGPTPPPTRRTP